MLCTTRALSLCKHMRWAIGWLVGSGIVGGWSWTGLGWFMATLGDDVATR